MGFKSMMASFKGIGQGMSTPEAAADPGQPDPQDPQNPDPNNADDPDNQTARQKLRQNMQEVIDEDAADEMEGDGEAAQARRREQARCAAIFADPAAANNQEQAAHFAFNTRLKRGDAIEALKRAPAGAAGGGLAAAMAQHAGKGPGAGAPAPAASAKDKIVSGWDAAMQGAQGRKPGAAK